MSQTKMVAAKIIVAQHNVELEDVLEAAGVTDGNGDSEVDQGKVLDTLSLVSIEEQEANRAKQPTQPTRLQKSRLADVNRRAREMRTNIIFRVGTKIDQHRPEKVGKTGKIRFWVHGTECYMNNIDFARALDGQIPFEGPMATRADKMKLAEELKQIISEIFPYCALCGMEIDDYGPEEAMVNQMINGGVLRESGNRPRKDEGEFQIKIRRLDIFCRMWDDSYSDMLIELAMDPDLDVDKFLMEKSQVVTAKVRDKRPETTELEVLMKLKTIRAHLRGLKAIGEQPE